MSVNENYTNLQLAARGNKRTDNGEIEHKNEKIKNSRTQDNVKPKS